MKKILTPALSLFLTAHALSGYAADDSAGLAKQLSNPVANLDR